EVKNPASTGEDGLTVRRKDETLYGILMSPANCPQPGERPRRQWVAVEVGTNPAGRFRRWRRPGGRSGRPPQQGQAGEQDRGANGHRLALPGPRKHEGPNTSRVSAEGRPVEGSAVAGPFSPPSCQGVARPARKWVCLSGKWQRHSPNQRQATTSSVWPCR